MRSQQAQLSFSAGVLSPRLAARADSEKYTRALQTGKNWIISPQGGMVLREGMKFIGEPDSNAAFRTLQFKQGGNASDIIFELTAGNLQFWQDDALLADSYTMQYAQDELEAVQFTNEEHTGILVHGDYQPEYFALDGVSIENTRLPFSKVPWISYEDSKSPGNDAGISATYALTFTNGASDSWSEGNRYYVHYGNQTAHTGFPEPLPLAVQYSATTATNEARILNALRQMFYLNDASTHTITVNWDSGTTYDIVITGPYAGRELSITPEEPTDLLYDVQQTGDISTGDEPAWSFPYVVEHGGTPNYYQCIVPHDSDSTTEPGVGGSWEDVWTDLGTTAPAWYDWQHGGSNAWATDQQYGPWDRGFPTVSMFNDQRLLLMANKDMPTGIWGSRIGVYDDFIGGANDSDPFFFALATDDSPTIKWAASSQIGLIIGTSAGDWLIAADVTLGPTDIDANRQNSARSSLARAVTIDNEIFYIEQGGKKVRVTRYLREALGFSSADASAIAEHLVSRPGIKRLVLMHTPETLLLALRNDGQLTALAYDRSNEVAAWSELETNGTVEDMCAIYSLADEQDYIYLSVTRGENTYLERMQYPVREFEDDLSIQGVVCMDSWVAGAFSPGPPTIATQITGLDHLEGLGVGLLLDDAYGGEHLVSGGKILLSGLETAPTSYAVGLLYDSDGLTFENPGGNPRGIAFGTKRRWNKLWVRLLDSAIPLINGKRPPDRHPDTAQLSVEAIRPGVRDYAIPDLGWADGAISIVQDRPYPTHVLALFGEYGSENS